MYLLELRDNIIVIQHGKSYDTANTQIPLRLDLI